MILERWIMGGGADRKWMWKWVKCVDVDEGEKKWVSDREHSGGWMTNEDGVNGGR